MTNLVERAKEWVVDVAVAATMVLAMKIVIENELIKVPVPIVFMMPGVGAVHGLIEQDPGDSGGVWVGAFGHPVSIQEACWKAAPYWDKEARQDIQYRAILAIGCVRLSDVQMVDMQRVKLVFTEGVK